MFPTFKRPGNCIWLKVSIFIQTPHRPHRPIDHVSGDRFERSIHREYNVHTFFEIDTINHEFDLYYFQRAFGSLQIK